ncbi:MAG: hypothetical protein N4A72_00785 [Bacteroidales bacterium]|jgi:hypothetical protein|nr:hypothetical protein [Bacteroidales bacterium]
MKKYKIEVTRTDEYEITIDENIWNEEELKKWSSVFSEVEAPEDLACTLALDTAIQGSLEFIEGFGRVKTLSDGSVRPHFEGFKEVPEEKYTEGITLEIISEGEQRETEVTELEEP